MVSPNKGTLKFCENESNKGIFPLFVRFPYLKNFDEISPKNPKQHAEVGLSDHSRQISTIFGSFRRLVLNFWTKSFKFCFKWATISFILPKNWPIFMRFLTK